MEGLCVGLFVRYAMNPSYYNDLDCDVIGTPIEHESSNSDGVYVYGDFGCAINL